MGELLLELLSEEIPARMQRRAIDDLVGLVRDKLAAAEIPAATIAGYVTPRRLTVIADGIPPTQPDRSEERRGPRVGAPEAAINGFVRAAGLASIDQCERRGEFYFAVIQRNGQSTEAVLPGLLMEAIAALSWPKSMRFPAADLRWVRPLNSAICLFDGAEIALPLGAVPVGRATRGHRFLSPGEIAVANAADYRAKLAEGHVVIDRAERRALIAKALDAKAAGEGLKVKADEGLLEEVTGLVEYPVVLSGTIDTAFMDLPPEVLSTAMRTHQKYFSALDPNGSPAPRFLFVANNLTADNGAAIAAGNERVLRARLSDARFFWDQDRKLPLADRVGALKERVFHARLGSVYDKVERVERLAEALAAHVPGADVERVRRAACLAKADLSTGMVGEFPELQGVMGRYYALNDGEAVQVADAIADHYKPLGPGDTCPAAPDSVTLALADKIDTLTAFFGIGEPPTGSRDPFALRRAALGMIRIILENSLRLSLHRFVTRDVLNFVADRLKVHLREQGVRHDLIAAVFALDETDLVRLLARVSALQAFLDSEDGANLLIAYRRAANIVAIEERKDGQPYGGADRPALLVEPEEQALVASLDEIGGQVGGMVGRETFGPAMTALSRLRQPVDEFFDRVTVNVEVKELRENRLRLLSRIRATMNQVADFSQIEG
ncbi:MAG TPA: glycine--tRNA ligase subunit beta [Stellaceae bacterium]|nr:glycine--tRNA ligase subunit beta [Stellaceae bacterium]